MRLSVNLRSTIEIISYIERYRNHDPMLKCGEFRCTTAHNLHGEKSNIRPCDGFINESLKTIEEYLQKSCGLDYLPVVLEMPEETKERLKLRLKERNIQFEYYLKYYFHNRGLAMPTKVSPEFDYLMRWKLMVCSLRYRLLFCSIVT